MSLDRSTRRQWLQSASLIALAPSVPAFLARTARAAEVPDHGRTLVVVQLDGGNDGLNTIVPFDDEGYFKYRPSLRIETSRLVRVGDHVGFHPALRPAADLLEGGSLAVVQGVGYPNPNRSHATSMAIWHTARFDPDDHTSYGWIGRALDERAADAGEASAVTFLGTESVPAALHGRRTTALAMDRLDELQFDEDGVWPDAPTNESDDLLAFVSRSALDARGTSQRLAEVVGRSDDAGEYPATELARRLKSIAALIKGGFTTPVYYAIQSGYDTHAGQAPIHQELLGELAGALAAFQRDLVAAKLDDRVATLCFSEFGRRVEENGSLGTDHGTAGPVFVMGSRVRAGMMGEVPKLLDLEDGDLKASIDFRRVYATLLHDWLGLPSREALNGEFDPLPLLRS